MIRGSCSSINCANSYLFNMSPVLLEFGRDHMIFFIPSTHRSIIENFKSGVYAAIRKQFQACLNAVPHITPMEC